MGRFCGVLKGAGAVTTEEVGRRHESAVEDVTFFDFRVVEEYREGNTVEESDDFRVRCDETTWWHVDSDDSGVVFLDS